MAFSWRIVVLRSKLQLLPSVKECGFDSVLLGKDIQAFASGVRLVEIMGTGQRQTENSVHLSDDAG
jgi:hypothetical protein